MFDAATPVPRRLIRICPVLKFAVKRTDSVKGRTKDLTNSITHKNGQMYHGAPTGWKWIKKSVSLNDILFIIIISQRVIAKENVIDKCLVVLNVNGVNPKRFKVPIITIIAVNNVLNPGMCFMFVRITKSFTVVLKIEIKNDFVLIFCHIFLNKPTEIVKGITHISK